MDANYGRGPSIQVRLVLAVISAIALLFVSANVPQFAPVKTVLNTVISPLYYLASLPERGLNTISDWVISRHTLHAENDRLRHQHLLDSEQLQRFSHLKRENQRLRALLSSPVQDDARRMVAEVLSVHDDPYRHLLEINRGTAQGVYVGQPVLDDSGVVGQIVEVGAISARVLLIADHRHAIPVRVARNDVRSVAAGTGSLDALQLQHVAHSTDIRVGDMLVSSGLGGRFPEGYPVARVNEVNIDEGQPFTEVKAKPVAALDRIRYVLLVWPKNSEFPELKVGEPTAPEAPATSTKEEP